MNILEKLQEIFIDIFDDKSLIISNETTSNDISDWDSFAQINLLATIENTFNIKFSIEEIIKLNNVGDIIKTIERKL